MNTQESQTYKAGVHNIGNQEARKRLAVGYAGAIFTAIIWFLFVHFRSSQGWRLLLVIPAALTALGFLQGFSNFCVAFALDGGYNFGATSDKAQKVTDAANHELDKKKANKLFIYATIIGVIVAIIAFAFPL